MAGRLAHLEGHPGGFDRVAALHLAIRRRTGQRDAVGSGQVSHRIGQLRGLAASDHEGAVRDSDFSSAALPAMWSACPCVFRMAASVSCRCSMVADNLIGVESRIEDNAVGTALQMGHIRVFRKQLRNHHFDNQFRLGHEILSP